MLSTASSIRSLPCTAVKHLPRKGPKLNPASIVTVLHYTAGGTVIPLCWWARFIRHRPARVQVHMLPDKLHYIGDFNVCMHAYA